MTTKNVMSDAFVFGSTEQAAHALAEAEHLTSCAPVGCRTRLTNSASASCAATGSRQRWH